MFFVAEILYALWANSLALLSDAAHLVYPQRPMQDVLEDVMDLLAKHFSLYHVAIQCEEHQCAMSRPEIEHYPKVEESAHEYSHTRPRIVSPQHTHDD